MGVVHSQHMDNHNIISHQAINSTAMIDSTIIIRVSTINVDIHNSLVAVKIKDGINISPWVVQDAETIINIITNHCIRMCRDQEVDLSMEEGAGLSMEEEVKLVGVGLHMVEVELHMVGWGSIW